MTLLSVPALMLVASCTAPPLPPDLVSVGSFAPSDAQIAEIQDAVRRELKDPASATFGFMTAGKNAQGRLMVCGLVNARNSFGGYTGMQPFQASIAPGGRVQVSSVGGPPEVTLAIYQVCERQGLSLRTP